MTNQAITIVGIMGVGKTSIAKKLAKKLGFFCVDTDKEIKKKIGYSVLDLMKNNEEQQLKETEYEIIKNYSKQKCIISTGDYTVNNQAAWDYLIHHTITIWMNISLYKVVKRLKPTENRPFMEKDFNQEKLQKIYNQRKKRYKHAKIELKNLNKNTLEELIAILNKFKINPTEKIEKRQISVKSNII